jgi:polysaccharide export outer membrane protein
MSLRNACLLPLLLLVLALVGCSSGGGVHGGAGATMAEAGKPLGAPDTTTSGGAYLGVSEYRVGPQDLIEISVFQVPDLSRVVRVNSGGQISLPLIGVVQAGGLTIQELEKSIAQKLSDKYLQNPQVTAFVKEFTSQRLTLEGAIAKPGIYPVTGRTTLLQAIALAGGLDKLADPHGIVIFRQISGKKMGAVFDLKNIRSGKDEDPLVYGDDIIVVEQSGSKTALRRFIEAMPVLNVFGVF